MSIFNRFLAFAVSCALSGPLIPLQAQTKKGDVFLAEGRLHESKKEWDAALESFQKAQAEAPDYPIYQLAVDKGRIQASQAHVDKGIALRSQGQLGDSLAEFQKAYAINPGSAIALQELEESRQMIQREQKRVRETGHEATPEVRALTPGQAAEREEADKISRMLPVPELVPSKPGAVDLKMTGTAKTIFEALGKSAGFRVLWDPNYTPPERDSLTVDFKHSTVDQSLDYLAGIGKLSWKRLSPTVVYVTNQGKP